MGKAGNSLRSGQTRFVLQQNFSQPSCFYVCPEQYIDFPAGGENNKKKIYMREDFISVLKFLFYKSAREIISN